MKEKNTTERHGKPRKMKFIKKYLVEIYYFSVIPWKSVVKNYRCPAFVVVLVLVLDAVPIHEYEDKDEDEYERIK